jgi:hypothetical protein
LPDAREPEVLCDPGEVAMAYPAVTGRRVMRGVGTFLSGVVVAVIGTVAVTSDDEVIGRPVARDFFEQYWTDAVRHPERSWPRLTDGFKENHGDLTYEKYREYFGQYVKVDVDSIVEYDGVPNRFELTLRYDFKGSRSDVSERTAYSLECNSWKNYVSFVSCAPEDLKINDGLPLTPVYE